MDLGDDLNKINEMGIEFNDELLGEGLYVIHPDNQKGTEESNEKLEFFRGCSFTN